MKATQAMKASAQLLKGRWWPFLKRFLGLSLILGLVIGLVAIVWLLFVYFLTNELQLDHSLHQSVILSAYLLQNMVITLFTLLVLPFELHHLTAQYLELTQANERFSELIPEKLMARKAGRLDKLLGKKWVIALGSLILIAVISLPMGFIVQELKQPYQPIEIIAHRAGGYEVPENSMTALKHAHELGVKYAEIDVQRTKDGQYILNHDNTFARVAGDDRSSQEMTLEEIKRLDIGTKFNPKYAGERVPTLDEVLAYSKDKLTLFIELKGVTADHQMVKDVYALLKKHNLEKSAVLVSLNVDLISHIEENYSIDTGLIYFTSLGDVTAIKGTYLIMEDNQATKSRIEQVHSTSKKVIVWTVNEDDAMERLTQTEIDGIITDQMTRLKEVIQVRDKKTDRERLFDLFLKPPGK